MTTPSKNTFLKTRLPRERALVQLNSHSDSSGSLRRDIDKRSAFQIRDKSPLKNWLVRRSQAIRPDFVQIVRAVGRESSARPINSSTLTDF